METRYGGRFRMRSSRSQPSNRQFGGIHDDLRSLRRQQEVRTFTTVSTAIRSTRTFTDSAHPSWCEYHLRRRRRQPDSGDPSLAFRSSRTRATVAQALRAFPQYQGVTTVASPYAFPAITRSSSSSTNACREASASTVAYTFSKHLSDGRGFTDAHGAVIRQNYFQREKSLYVSDQTHILTFSFNYALPVGPGRAANLGRVGNGILGGWSQWSWCVLKRLPARNFDSQHKFGDLQWRSTP